MTRPRQVQGLNQSLVHEAQLMGKSYLRRKQPARGRIGVGLRDAEFENAFSRRICPRLVMCSAGERTARHKERGAAASS